MIPPFNHSHVLPPFTGASVLEAGKSSPYLSSALGVATHFGLTRARCVLLDGWLRYRAALRDLGFVQGFQWLDGSFAEDVEAHRGKPPQDVDLVTFARTPHGLSSQAVEALLAANPDVFMQDQCKAKFGCDAYIVPLDKSPESLVKRASYYLQLYSHRRGDQVWKGLLHVPLESDDALARQLIDNALTGENDAAAA